MNAETLKLILTAAGLVLALITTIVTAVAKNTKSAKAAKVANMLLSITSAATQFVAQAELITGFTGANKKEWVMTKLNQYCIENQINWDEKIADEAVEKLITFSKDVNAKSKGNEEQL